MSKCEKCKSGATGIDGHENLFAHTMSGRTIQMKCRRCESFWIRIHASDGSYSWSLIAGEQAGPKMPGR